MAVKWLWWMAAAGIITAAATWLLGPYGLTGIAAIVILAVLALQKPSAEQSATRTEDYRRTGLTEPKSWEPGPVADKMDQLAEKLSTVKYRDKITQKIEQLQEQLKDLEPEIDGIKKRHAGWLEQLKSVPNLPEENVKKYSGLYWFLVYVKEWQEKHSEARALTEQKEELKDSHARILEKINQHLQKYQAAEVTDAASARATWKRLKDEESVRSKNTDDINRQKRSIEEYNQQLEAKEQALEKIYNKLGLQQGMKQRVKELTDRLEEYREMEKQYNEQHNRLKVKREGMEKHPLFDDHRDEVETLTPERVEDMIDQYDQQASRLEETRDEIARINERIESTSKGNDLEQALTKKDEALDKLEDQYRQNLSSLTGHILVEELKQESQQENQTPVFKRADELFRRITRGRYELRLEENDDTVFKAFDTVKNRGQHLDELSTGTRIQLLLAVRLAYIETQESTLKLPILADELLANSDDARATAIIDALVEISRDGRQVFYFTAQSDEVAKWRHHLDNDNPIPYEVFEITGENRESPDYSSTEPAFRNLELTGHQVPVPNGKSHEQYGKELEVPPFNPVTDNIESLHLWYLVEDISLLYNCLSMSISYWGQLKSFRESNGQIKGLDESTFDHLKEKTRVLEHFQELYRQGRPYPIDRDVLEASDAISDTFLDKVAEKMKHLHHQPDSLLRALRNGEVARFKSAKADELEEYLYSQGYLKEEKALGQKEILVRLQAMISNMNISPGEAERMINRLLKP
jgi:FtsZ-binding cell division protein ZapB